MIVITNWVPEGEPNSHEEHAEQQNGTGVAHHGGCGGWGDQSLASLRGSEGEVEGEGGQAQGGSQGEGDGEPDHASQEVTAVGGGGAGGDGAHPVTLKWNKRVPGGRLVG